jgi:cell division GTPase FtsZ
VDFAGATGALVHVAGDNHMTVEEVNRVGEIVTEMMHDNAHVIWGAKVNPQQEGKLKVTLLMTGVNSAHISTGLGTIAPQLFDLEPHQQLEKPLDLKLDLYQMESF